jgi:hypothetical protein
VEAALAEPKCFPLNNKNRTASSHPKRPYKQAEEVVVREVTRAHRARSCCQMPGSDKIKYKYGRGIYIYMRYGCHSL